MYSSVMMLKSMRLLLRVYLWEGIECKTTIKNEGRMKSGFNFLSDGGD
jgi:hypothetical protein